MSHIFKKNGFTLIDAIIGLSLLVIVILGIYGTLNFSLKMNERDKARIGAVSLANEQMEKIRNLAYNDIGTEGGIPPGPIPQNQTISLNNIQYTIKTFIQYIDDPSDGEGENDENGITADYKKARIEVTWPSKQPVDPVIAISNFAPPGIETIEGGGTLIIQVFNAQAEPIAQANVHIVNPTVDPPIDLITLTNDQGKVIFPGTPAASSYQVIVTKEGYSTAQTYDATPENPNPNPGHLTILESQTTEASFIIDRLSNLTITTVEPPSQKEWNDSFDSTTKIEESYQIEISEGQVKLAMNEGIYQTSGYLISTTIAPGSLASWSYLNWTDDEPSNTDIKYQILYDSGDNWIPIPDEDLTVNGIPNSTGFDEPPVDISDLDTTQYNHLRLKAILSTENTDTTPSLDEWSLSWITSGGEPISNANFIVRGTKTIGTDGEGQPIYKYEETFVTNSNGVVEITNLEWDIYEIEMIIDGNPDYDIGASSPPEPIDIEPDTNNTLQLTLYPHAQNTLLVLITNASGESLKGASVRLINSDLNYDETIISGDSGHSFFTPLVEKNDYRLEVTLNGYEDYSLENIEVDGQTEITVIMTEL